ncbi:MAG: response regulator, partial [Caldilineaceae bacterium]|nr:response regulator [Caldilineaceae bacterium]
SVRQFILGIRNGRAQTPTHDLFTALDLYLDQVRERHGVTVQVSLPEELPDQLLSTQVETQLLRIIQEAVANICKHAGVDTARIVFLLQPDELQVMISDEGRGFAIDPSSQTAADQATFAHESRITHHVSRLPSPLPSLHFGLDIMRERAEGVGGKVEIRSTPGHGTQVLVTMPRRLELQPQEELRGLRVLLADDHPLYREGLRNMLSVRGIHVVGIAEDGHEAEQLAHQLLPDLILMDIEMPNCDGVAATKAIKAALPAIKIVMLTVAAGTDLLLTALKNGASGYLLKNLATDQFFALLSEVLQGETVLSPKLMTSMVSTLTSDQVATEGQNGSGQEAPSQAAGPDRAAVNTQIQQLTNRQREVLDLIVQGLTNKEIARELHITERTVKYHVGLILEQMDAQSRYDLIYLTQSVAGLATNGHQEK